MNKETIAKIIKKLENESESITNVILIMGDECDHYTDSLEQPKPNSFSAKFSDWHKNSKFEKLYKEIAVYLYTVKNEDNSINWYTNIVSDGKIKGSLKGNVSSIDRSKFEPLVFSEILSFIKSNDSKENDLFIVFKQSFVSEYIAKMVNQNIRFYVQKADWRKKDSNEEIKNANEWRKFGELYSEFYRVKIETIPENDSNLLAVSRNSMNVKRESISQ